MKPACTYTNIVEIVADTQIPAADKGDVLVIGGSYMRELYASLKKNRKSKIYRNQKEKNINANAQSISFPALPCNSRNKFGTGYPFAVKHNLSRQIRDAFMPRHTFVPID